MRLRMLVKPAIEGEKELEWEYDGPDLEMTNYEGMLNIHAPLLGQPENFILSIPSSQVEAVWKV